MGRVRFGGLMRFLLGIQTVVGSALVTDPTTTFPAVSEKDPLL